VQISDDFEYLKSKSNLVQIVLGAQSTWGI